MGKTFPTPLGLISKPLVNAQPVPEESLIARLGGNVRDAFFPRKLPPLELQSQPVAVADRMAVKRSPLSSTLSFVLHAGAFALIFWFILQAREQIVAPKPVQITPMVYVKPFIPPVTLPAPKSVGGGGGGGEHQVVPPVKGHPPIIAKTQIVPVETLRVDHPKLVATPTVAAPQPVKLPMNAKMPNLGITDTPQVAMASHGGGAGGGIGMNRGGGIGSGIGSGLGAGTGGGYGGGVMSVGGGVSAPQLIHRVEPAFSDAARTAKYTGTVSIRLIVDPQGNPQDIHVVRHLGMGLDEKAIEAVRQYKFKPAMYQGHPVPVQMIVDVDFHLD